ncbi:MAG TPA: hypothetical protein VFW66_14335 [Gemmatimonadales bacterium]|nr:hypothetical protein [Gemmatimonadales bacterium]
MRYELVRQRLALRASTRRAARTAAAALAAAATLATTACLGGGGGNAGGLPSSQQFTREVNADARSVVTATLATFSRFGIPVQTADQTSGVVRSVPLDLRGTWGPTRPSDRVSCPGGLPADTTVTHVTFNVQVKPAKFGSVVSLDAQRQGGSGCVLQSSFVTQLLDDIARGAGRS